MAAKIGTVRAEVLLRVAGEQEAVGTIDMPAAIDGTDGKVTVTFAKKTVRHQLKKLGRRIARSLA